MSVEETNGRGVLDIWLRVLGGFLLIGLLVFTFKRIAGFGDAAIYTATWITFLHACIGEYVLVRYLHVRTRIQNVMDALAFTFLVGGCLSFSSTPVWCAFFAGVFAMAVVKYMLVARMTADHRVKKYATEKLCWESPVVIALTITAVVLEQLPRRGAGALILEICILTATTAFAVWMIGIRHIYRQVRRRSTP